MRVRERSQSDAFCEYPTSCVSPCADGAPLGMSTVDCGGTGKFLVTSASISVSSMRLVHLGQGTCMSDHDDDWFDLCGGLEVVWTTPGNTARFTSVEVFDTTTSNTAVSNMAVYIVTASASEVTFVDCVLSGNGGGTSCLALLTARFAMPAFPCYNTCTMLQGCLFL